MITIPRPTMVKPTTTPVTKPGQAKIGMVNPGPVKISTSGTTGTGGVLCEPTTTRTGYYGFNLRSNTPIGASSDDEAFAPVSGCMIDGFAGVQPGVPVYVDPTARPSPEGNFSGLTHTQPGTDIPIGIGATTTKIWLHTV